MPSMLWRCWLDCRKGIRPVKNWVVGCWHGYLSGAMSDLHMAQLMPLPLTVSCFSKIQIGFAFLVPAHPGCPGKRAVKRVCVWVIAFVLYRCLMKINPAEGSKRQAGKRSNNKGKQVQTKIEPPNSRVLSLTSRRVVTSRQKQCQTPATQPYTDNDYINR